MKAYFIRRFLLIPLTLLGVTLIVFSLTRIMPGSPIEREMQQAAAAQDNTASSATAASQGSASDAVLEELEEEYGYDKPVFIAYLQWLGIMPRQRQLSKAEFGKDKQSSFGTRYINHPQEETVVILKGSGRLVRVNKQQKTAVFLDNGRAIETEGWQWSLESSRERAQRWARRNKKEVESAPSMAPRAVVYQTRFSGLFQGDLGRSATYQDPVIDMILERVPIALYFGLLSTIIIYGVCIPLGVVKAIGHRTFLDNATSILIFIGYSIPGFALGALLLVYLGARMGAFPLFGLTSPGFGDMSFWAQVKDIAHHTVLPLSCYIVGGFAYTTMMMKNNLMDNLAADYVRTAVAKGVSFRRAVFFHAFRNSFIPIATSLGGLITLFIGGSMLVESVFDIQGFGLLQFQAIANRDQAVIMGTLTIAAFLMVLGNILSDFIVSCVDPRIQFH